jgi:hypothetical protein
LFETLLDGHMRSTILLMAVLVLVGCAHVEDPKALAKTFAGADVEQVGAHCKAAIAKAESFDDRTLERHGVGLVISTVMGPLGWVVNLARGLEHQKSKQAVAENFKKNCSSPAFGSVELVR